MHFRVEAQAIGRLEFEIEREVLGHRFAALLEAEEFGRERLDAEVRNLGQRTRNDAVAFDNRRRSVDIEGEEGRVVDQCQAGEFVERRIGFGAQVFCRDDGVASGALPLQHAGEGPAVTLQVGGAHAAALGYDHAVVGREVCRVEFLFTETCVGRRGDAETAAGRQVARTVAGVGDLRGVGAGDQFLLRIGQLDADHATAGQVEGVRSEDREAGRPFFGQIADIGFDRARQVEARIVERLAGDEVDRARDAAFDHVGGDVLEHFDTAEQFGRDVVEGQGPAAIGREDVAPVQLGPDIGEAADDDAGAFDREAVRIVGAFEAADVHTGDALQRLGDRPVGQRADIFGVDGVDDSVGFALEILGRFQRAAEAADDDRVLAVLDDGFVVVVRRILSEGRLRGDQCEAGCGGERGDSARDRRNSIGFQRHVSSLVPRPETP